MPHGQGIDYQPLSSSRKEIRTLTLFAGKLHDPIQCALSIVSLPEQPHYEALSYTWGDASVTQPIEVGGVQFDATANLERALRHLREENDDLILWVDAVCINQSDIEEKSHQVAMMGEIYRRCSQVRIWLGCDEAQCGLEQPLQRVDSMMSAVAKPQNPFELIHSLSADRHIHEWPCFQGDEGETKIASKDSKTFDACWEGFRKVAQSSWWTRIWTIQEVILPKAGILIYDTWSTSLDDITKCGTNYYKHIWDCCQYVTRSLPDTMAIELDEFCTVFFGLDRDRNSITEDEFFDIQEQHLAYGFRQCQNPRDKVYGLLALIGDISDLDLWLTPDYSKSANEVFYDTTCAMLYRDTHGLKCLTGAQNIFGPDKWASWVRDFGGSMTQLEGDVGSNRLIIYDLFDSSQGRKAKYEHFMTWPLLADEKPFQVGLGVAGRCVGNVASVCAVAGGKDSTKSVEERKSIFREWADAAQVDFEQSPNRNQYPDATLNFWRTLLGGVMSAGHESAESSDWRRFNNETIAWIENFSSWIQTSKEDLNFALDRTLLIATEGRCYFQAQDGGQGLCYPSVEAGDEVWVVDGSKLPFILRRVHLDSDESTELRSRDAYGVNEDGVYGLRSDFEPGDAPCTYYSFVGDCYFDGFMDGEAVGDANKSIVLV